LYDDRIPAWISRYMSKKNYVIDPRAAMLLTEYLGSDLSKIANELDKLMITINDPGKQITPDIIQANIGISKEFNNFELQSALVSRDAVKANRIVNYFAENQKSNPITLTITALFSFFSKILLIHSLPDKSTKNIIANLKIHPYFVKEYEVAAKTFSSVKTVQIISLLREYDLKSKGFGNISASAGDLLKELVYKIMH
jgi:DNA polymerase-3 subunit delta